MFRTVLLIAAVALVSGQASKKKTTDRYLPSGAPAYVPQSQSYKPQYQPAPAPSYPAQPTYQPAPMYYQPQPVYYQPTTTAAPAPAPVYPPNPSNDVAVVAQGVLLLKNITTNITNDLKAFANTTGVNLDILSQGGMCGNLSVGMFSGAFWTQVGDECLFFTGTNTMARTASFSQARTNCMSLGSDVQLLNPNTDAKFTAIKHFGPQNMAATTTTTATPDGATLQPADATGFWIGTTLNNVMMSVDGVANSPQLVSILQGIGATQATQGTTTAPNAALTGFVQTTGLEITPTDLAAIPAGGRQQGSFVLRLLTEANFWGCQRSVPDRPADATISTPSHGTVPAPAPSYGYAPMMYQYPQYTNSLPQYNPYG